MKIVISVLSIVYLLTSIAFASTADFESETQRLRNVAGAEFVRVRANHADFKYIERERAFLSIFVVMKLGNPNFRIIPKAYYPESGNEVTLKKIGKLYTYRTSSLEVEENTFSVQPYLEHFADDGEIIASVPVGTPIVKTIYTTLINDPPIMNGDQSFSTDEDVPIQITLNGAVDLDSPDIQYSLVQPPTKGTLSNCLENGPELFATICQMKTNMVWTPLSIKRLTVKTTQLQTQLQQ